MYDCAQTSFKNHLVAAGGIAAKILPVAQKEPNGSIIEQISLSFSSRSIYRLYMLKLFLLGFKHHDTNREHSKSS